MAKDIPERHHYVPKFLTKRFANSKEQVFFRDREKNEIELRNYRSPFWKRHYYTARDENNDKDISAEIDFSEIEDKASPVIKKIFHYCTKGKYPVLSQKEKQIWDKFFALQYKRTPDRMAMMPETAEEILDQKIQNWRNETPENSNKILEMYLPNRERFASNITTRVQTRLSSNLLEPFFKQNLSFWVLSSRNRSFILGSNPVSKIQVVESDIFGTFSVHLWLPISSKVAVSHAPQGQVGKLLTFNSSTHVRQLNETIISQSSSAVSNSKKLLESLTKYW